MSAIASGNLQEMTISSPVASLAFDGAALNTITGAASGDVSFSASRVDTASLPAAIQTLIGNRPVYEFSVTSGGNTISQFNGNVTVAVPYRLAAGEDPNAVIISFINAGGNLEIVTNGRYDAGNTYYTGYLAAAKRLGITSGVGDNKFAPEQSITRQEIFTLLYKALKALDKLPAVDSGKTLADFTDSGSVADWAAEALTALTKSGTLAGSGGKLDPTAGSTRAQMAQVLYNLLRK